MWSRLTEPAAELTTVSARERARWLASLLVVRVPVGFISGLVQLATIPGFAPTFAMMCGALAILTATYAAVRIRYYRVGAWVASLTPVAACAGVGANNPGDQVWYAFMLIGVLLASMLLTLAEACIVAAACIGTAIAVVVATPELHVAGIYVPILALHAVVSVLVLATAHQRNVLEARRRGELEASERRRREAERLETLGRLAGGIAHDFNNLLSVVLLNAGCLGNSESNKKFTDEIERAADLGAKLIQQMLEFARKQPIEPIPVCPGALVSELAPILARLAGPSVSLEIDATGTSAHVCADPSQLEQVVLNHVANARDAVRGRGRVTLTVDDIVAAGADRVRIAVSDDGPGIAADVIDHIFEPFFTTRRDEGGTGLGLATVQGIVLGAGGTLTVDARPGAGATFTALLPIVEVAAAATTPPPVPPGIILVVDDDLIARRTATRCLVSEGFRVLTADSGEAALQVHAEHSDAIAVVVTDVLMPGMGGRELAQRLRDRRPELKILMASAFERPIDLGGAVDGFFAKPFTAEPLAQAIRQLLPPR